MQKQDAWARFWQGGSLTSFGDRFASGYSGDIRELWQEFFRTLPDGAAIVDFGAGNGALEEIAEAFSIESGKPFTLHAIDLAPVRPARFVSQAADAPCRVVWHAATPNEATGLAAGSIDAVVGNYAIEYGNDDKTVDEIARILKAGGRGQFLVHHHASNIIRNSAVELEVLDAELAKGGFIDAVRDYLREFGDIRKPAQFEKLKQSGKAEPYRLRMNEMHQKALRHATTQNATVLIQQIMQWTGQLVSPPAFFQPKQVLLDRLREVRAELAANRSRLRDMQSAAVDDARLQRILELFGARGMRADAQPFYVKEEETVVGWRLNVTRE